MTAMADLPCFSLQGRGPVIPTLPICFAIRDLLGHSRACGFALSGEESGSFLDGAVPLPLTKLRIFWSSRLMGGFVAEVRSGLEPRFVHGRWSERRGALQKSFRKGNLKIKSMWWSERPELKQTGEAAATASGIRRFSRIMAMTAGLRREAVPIRTAREV
jgi:hypothetical protein